MTFWFCNTSCNFHRGSERTQLLGRRGLLLPARINWYAAILTNLLFIFVYFMFFWASNFSEGHGPKHKYKWSMCPFISVPGVIHPYVVQTHGHFGMYQCFSRLVYLLCMWRGIYRRCGDCVFRSVSGPCLHLMLIMITPDVHNVRRIRNAAR